MLVMTAPEDLSPYSDTALYAGFDPQLLASQRTDAHLMLLDDDEPIARCSLWWRDAPRLGGAQVGIIGHYQAASATEDSRAGTLLDNACGHLASRGCSLAIGPMDGTTWRRYRFITDRGDEPTFFLEPDNPDAFPLQWSRTGFEPLAEYFSALDTDLTRRDPRLPAASERLAREGVSVRALDPGDFENELGRVYEVSVASFQRNLLYTPLPEAEFRAQYRAILPHARPELALIAEEGSRPVGFVFAVPDVAQQLRGEPVNTVIVKTVAVLPGRRYAGLGALLVERVQLTAADLGFTRAIHALMYASNSSRSISAHYASPMRRYTLYARRLG